MKTFASLLFLLAPALTVCTDARPPESGASSTAGSDSLTPIAIGDAQDTTQLVVRRVWTGDHVSPHGGLTPDGRYVTFVEWPRNDLALRDMETGEVRYLTDRAAGDPEGAYPDESIVSPDGKRVAYHWYPGEWLWEMHVVDIDGSNRKVLLKGVEGWAEPVDFSPDGEEVLVALQQKDDGPFVLELVSVEDGSTRILKEFPPTFQSDARFSADGRFIVYERRIGDGAQRDIFILSMETGQESPLVQDPADDYLLGWVPGTDKVLFASDRTGAFGAWVLKVQDGKTTGPPTLVKPNLWQVRPTGFTEDGSFYYGVRVSTRGVHLATIDPETKRIIGDPMPVDPRELGSSERPRWSPDGRFLSYLKANGGTGERVAIRSMETGETRFIDPKLTGRCPARWSPDSRSFVFCGTGEGGRTGIFLVDVQTGETVLVKHIQDNGASFWTDWDPDGKTVYYRVDYGDESRIVALDIETGTERTIRKEFWPDWIVMIFVDVSPDGKELAFWEMVGGDKMRLTVIPTDPGEEGSPGRTLVEVDPVPGPQPGWGYVRWSQDGRYVMYLDLESDPPRLWQVPAGGGEPEPLEYTLEEFPQFSPDGTRVAIDYGESDWELWVMENYLPKGG